MIDIQALSFPAELSHLRSVLPKHQITLSDLCAISGPVVAALATSQMPEQAARWKALATQVLRRIGPRLPPVAAAAIDRLERGETQSVVDTIHRVRAEMTTAAAVGAPQFDWPVALDALHSAVWCHFAWDTSQTTLAARWLAEAIDAALALDPEGVAALCNAEFSK